MYSATPGALADTLRASQTSTRARRQKVAVTSLGSAWGRAHPARRPAAHRGAARHRSQTATRPLRCDARRVPPRTATGAPRGACRALGKPFTHGTFANAKACHTRYIHSATEREVGRGDVSPSHALPSATHGTPIGTESRIARDPLAIHFCQLPLVGCCALHYGMVGEEINWGQSIGGVGRVLSWGAFLRPLHAVARNGNS